MITFSSNLYLPLRRLFGGANQALKPFRALCHSTISSNLIEEAMPQIWMTYDEIGAMLNCSSADARSHAVERGLDRKISRDGKTRAKLCVDLIGVFFDQVRASEPAHNLAVDSLRRVHTIMSKNSIRSDHQEQPTPHSDGRRAAS
jgi:hypothetical protein